MFAQVVKGELVQTSSNSRFLCHRCYVYRAFPFLPCLAIFYLLHLISSFRHISSHRALTVSHILNDPLQFSPLCSVQYTLVGPFALCLIAFVRGRERERDIYHFRLFRVFLGSFSLSFYRYSVTNIPTSRII